MNNFNWPYRPTVSTQGGSGNASAEKAFISVEGQDEFVLNELALSIVSVTIGGGENRHVSTGAVIHTPNTATVQLAEGVPGGLSVVITYYPA